MKQEPAWLAAVLAIDGNPFGELVRRYKITWGIFADALEVFRVATTAREEFLSEFDSRLQQIGVARTPDERIAAFNAAQRFRAERGEEVEHRLFVARGNMKVIESQEAELRGKISCAIKRLRDDLNKLDPDAIGRHLLEEEDSSAA